MHTDQIDASKLYDAVVIGGGPAGLTAALYLARARCRVLVVERERFGGQITITDEVVNYPGVLSATGAQLTETMRCQAASFGAEFLFAEVTSLDLAGEVKIVHTTKGPLYCHAALLATGATPRPVGFEGEEEFRGHGVAYCATCDGEFFTGKDVFVVGGGFAAAEESVFLTKYARRVTVLVREDDFTCAPAAAEQAKAHPKVDVLYHTELVAAGGDGALSWLRYRDVRTGEEREHRAPAGEVLGIFVFVGYSPATELVRGVAELDDQGYVITDAQQMSTARGLFAAGDVCVKTLRQVATAVGQAAQTATDMERFIKDAQERTRLVPPAPLGRSGHGDSALGEPTPRDLGRADGPQAGSRVAAGLFDDEMTAQLDAVFSRMENPLVLRLHVNDSPVSSELATYVDELASRTDKISVQRASVAGDDAGDLPYVEVCRWGSGGPRPSGLAFHGVPGGHEFTSFVLGLYNASGPGQPIDESDRARIAAIDSQVDIKVLVGLSCTMCPETVVSAQRIAADNAHVTAEVYDLNRFAGLRERYNVMSVPCTVIRRYDGTEQTLFGKKGLSQMLDLIG